jgi:hypothetical protein
VNKNGLSVEFFLDEHSHDIDSLSIDPLIAGIKGISKIIGKFDVLGSDGVLRLTQKQTKNLNANTLFDASPLPADLNVVMTDRRLTHDGQLLAGVAQIFPGKSALGTRLAIVTTYKNEGALETTGTHEIAHTLNFRHCSDERCIMHLYGHHVTDEFCDECTTQFPKNIDRILRAKNRKKIAKKALFPVFAEQFPDDPFFQ